MISRRRFLELLGALGLASLPTAGAQPSKGADDPALRIAHLTDLHVGADLLDPTLESGTSQRGLARAIRHVQSLPYRPDFILQGGDAIHDALGQPREQVERQWRALSEVLEAELALPIYHCIGNHDIWGYDLEASGTTGNESDWGKTWALRAFGLETPYYSFDQGAWHFVVLDSIQPDDEEVYLAQLDEAQLEWLEIDLISNAAKPTLILSHAPILAACAFFGGNNELRGDWLVPSGLMHIDARRLKDLLDEQPQVKLCLSGHVHLRDEVRYNGVTYACNGAVSGASWYGSNQETEAGYAVVDLWNDGRVSVEYVRYSDGAV